MNLKKRTAIVIGVVALLLATAGLVAATMIPSAEDLLTASLERLEVVTSGHAVINMELQMPERDVSGTVEIWGEQNAGANGEPAVRVVVHDASESEFAGLMLVSDGSQFWLFNPVLNSVIVGQADELTLLLAERMAEYDGQWNHGSEFDPQATNYPETPAEAVEQLLAYFTVGRSGSGQIGENEADILRLVPIAEEMPEEIRLAGGYVNLWLRASDQLPIGAEYAEGAVGYARAEASQIQINEPIDSSLFSFDVPQGVEVIQATDLLAQMETFKHDVDTAELDILAPGELPTGSKSMGTEQFGDTMVQRYTLPGERSFVIAQGASVPLEAPAEATHSETVTVRGSEGLLHTNEDASRTLLVWQEQALFLMVAGDLSPEQALAVAESLQ